MEDLHYTGLSPPLEDMTLSTAAMAPPRAVEPPIFLQVNYSYCVVYKCQRVIQGGLSTTTRGVPVDYEIRRKNAAINPDSGMRCDDDEKNKIVMVSLQVSVNHRNTLTRKKRV